jgi:hypothetical protein
MKELAQCIETIKNIVNSIDESTFEEHHKVLLDCSDLPILSPGDEPQCFSKLPDFFEALNVAKQPAIYWFVVTSTHNSKQIISKVKEANGNVNRQFPMLDGQRAYKFESKVLYVGKTSSDLKGRMVSHLGYHKKSDNHGLQLCHWAADLKLKLELNYICLSKELEGLTELFERELSKQLKPIIGRKA